MVNPNQLKGGLLLNKLANMLPDSRFLVTKGWSYVEAAPACSLESPNIRRMEWSPDVDAFYSQISLLLIPSLCCEGFGRVAREAILRGIPVVASNRGALRESACDTGVFLNPTSPAIWKRAILRILSDRTEYDRLSRRGFYAARATEARDRVARTRAIAAIRTAFGVRSGQ